MFTLHSNNSYHKQNINMTIVGRIYLAEQLFASVGNYGRSSSPRTTYSHYHLYKIKQYKAKKEKTCQKIFMYDIYSRLKKIQK